MIELANIDELAAKLAAALPPGAREMRAEAEQRFRALLTRAFEKMDLVTREEFDAQKAVLERAMVKLDSVRAQLEEFERDAVG